MPFAPFYKKFFDVADAETRAVIAAGDSGLPRGRYPFIEFYCNEPGCDCRRVIIHVMNENTRSLEAEISFGWESREFYREWMGDDDPEVLAMMQGPAFNIGGAVGEYADVLLELFRQTVRDPAYVDRLKRHYAMYRATVDRETPVASGVRRDAPKIGRNDPCPCGSGKKFKRCCDR